MTALNLLVSRKESLSNYGVFKEAHTPLLVFQSNALRHIRRNYHLTRVDFIVLTAGRMMQEDSLLRYFDSQGMNKVLIGVGANLVFKSLDKLRRYGMVALREARKRRRRFCVTEKGMACIQSFIQYYNYTLSIYDQNKYTY
jgi:hypothetical protein